MAFWTLYTPSVWLPNCSRQSRALLSRPVVGTLMLAGVVPMKPLTLVQLKQVPAASTAGAGAVPLKTLLGWAPLSDPGSAACADAGPIANEAIPAVAPTTAISDRR